MSRRAPARGLAARRAAFRAAVAAGALLLCARVLAASAAAPLAAAGGDAAAKPVPAAPAAPGPQPIPVAHVFRAADGLTEPLRKAELAADVDQALIEGRGRLAASEEAMRRLGADLEPERLRDASARELERLRQALAREDLALAAGQDTLDKRTQAVAASSRELQDLAAAWQLTAAGARKEQAPAAVLQRIAEVEARLHETQERLRTQQDSLLALQARVSALREEVAGLAASVEDASAALERQLFEAESVPLWRALGAPDRAGALGAELRQALRENGRDVAGFLADERDRVALHLLLVVALALALRALRRPVAAMGSDDAALRGAAQALARPWSAALLLSVLVADVLYPPRPPALADLVSLAFLVPLLRLLPGLLPSLYRRPLFGLAALFALDRVAALAPPRTLLARIAVLVVSAAALGGLVRGLRPGGWARFPGAGGWVAARRAAVFAALALLAASLLANVSGNTTLAQRLAHATLASATLGVVLLGVQVVLEGALAALLHLPGVRRRRVVARHQVLLQLRSATLLRWLLLAIWASDAADAFGVAGAVAASAGSVLALRLKVGGLDVSLGNVAAFAVTLVVALAASRAVRFLLDEAVFAEVDLPRGVPTAISTTVQYVLVLLGCSWAVLASGMETSRFSFLIGALGVGVGFGLQNVVNNLVSGLILLYERPVQIGDVVEVRGVSGEVTRIGVRSSTVRTFAGAEVIVPNATFISAEVTNWTLSDRRRRIELSVGAAYGTAPEQVIAILLAAVKDRPGVLADPAPMALLLQFGESSLDFALRFWTGDFDRWQVLASDVMIEVYASLGRAGIEIPFPQRDLHVRSLDPGVAEAVGAGGERPELRSAR